MNQRPADRPTRVLLVTPQPFFEDRGTPIAVACAARALAEAGREVDVLAFPVGRPLRIPGVRIWRSGNPCRIRRVPIGFSLRKLVLDASLVRRLGRQLAQRRYDIVHAVEEAAWFAGALCPSRRIPFIYDMASAIPDEVASHSLLGTAPCQSMLRSLERRVVARARHVLCSQGLARRVEDLETGTDVTEWRFPAFESAADPRETAQLRERLALADDQRVVLYAGNFSRYQGVDLLLDAFARVARCDPRVALVCVGAEDEAQANAMHARLPAGVRDRVRLVPRVERSEMPLWLSMADCLASPRSGGDNLPLKVLDYLAAGKPIVATRHGSHESVLGEGRGILCDGGPAALATGINRVFDDPGASRRMAERGRDYARDHHGWAQFSRFLNDVYDRAMGGERAPGPVLAPAGRA